MATAKVTFTPNPKLENEKTGLVIMGLSYADIFIRSKKDGLYLIQGVCEKADKGATEKETAVTKLKSNTAYLRVTVTAAAKCQFSYSTDGKTFISAGPVFTATPGKWIGAKVGLFASRDTETNDSGWADYDWFRVEPLK